MREESTIPYGYCHCGCGQKTAIARFNYPKFFHVIGEPKRFIVGHNARKIWNCPEWVEEDRGYKGGPCWIWQRSRNPVSGYGSLQVNRKPVAAHRVYYERYKGPIPEGMQVDHLCRQPDCVNPDHFEAVTNEVNTQRGKVSKLTEDAVREIRSSYPTKTIRELAERFGIHYSTVEGVVKRKSWKNVT